MVCLISVVFVLVFLVKWDMGVGAQSWWGNAVCYRVLVDSFKDSDGDGLGDLRGTTKQMSYVRALGADAIILSSISARSTDCATPGILDLTDIDPRYGNLEMFNSLLEKAKKLDLKVIVTLPLQTVSIESGWFKSSSDRATGFEDTIIWQEGRADQPPENTKGRTWVWHEHRNAYWSASNNEALLNLCSESVAASLSAAQCAWLRRGVAGILLNPDFTADQRCGEQLLRKLAAEAASCARAANLDTPTILAETSLKPELAANYYNDGGVGANSVLSNALTGPTRSNAVDMAMAFHVALVTAPHDLAPTWLTSNPNASRIATRYGSNMVDTINLITLILPGAAVIQQGDELGAADTLLEWATSSQCWPSAIAPSSAPFPWDSTINGGFTAGEPWLPLAPNYRYANAKTEFENDFSHVGVVRVAAAMRKSPAMGPYVEIKRLDGALAILRWGAAGSLLLITNLGRDQTEAQLSRIPGLPTEMTVAASSGGSSFTTGSHVTVEKALKLAPGETVLYAGGPRHCGGPGPVDKITNKLAEGWQKINKYFSTI